MLRDLGVPQTDPVEGVLSSLQIPGFQRGIRERNPQLLKGFAHRVEGLSKGDRGRVISGIISNLSREPGAPNQPGTPIWDIDAKDTAIDVIPAIGGNINDPTIWRKVQSDYTGVVKGLGLGLDPDVTLFSLLNAGQAIAPYTGVASAISFDAAHGPSEIADAWKKINRMYSLYPGWKGQRGYSSMIDRIRATAALTYLEELAYAGKNYLKLPLLDFYREHATYTDGQVVNFIDGQERPRNSLQAGARRKQLIVLRLLENPKASETDLMMSARATASQLGDALHYLESNNLVPLTKRRR